MLTVAEPLSPYHRLARTPAHRWWRTVLGTLFIVVGTTVLALGGYAVVTSAAVVAGRPDGPDGLPTFGALADLAVSCLMIAALLPAILLAARLIQERPAGTLSSVTGRLRLDWLLTCLAVAGVAIALFIGTIMVVDSVTGADTDLTGELAGWGPFLGSALVLLLVVPPQVAAEEYLTRGWLLQAVGAWCRRPWLPITVQAVVFAALHGWGTPWGFADLVLFGLVAGWLTVRTGGLEAAIALHLANNLLAFLVSAAFGEFGVDETAADMPWRYVVIDVPVLLGYAAVIAWLARRRNVRHTTPVPPVPAALPATFGRLPHAAGTAAQR
ncbi:membrane protease YdiL (CAAX protease family) [Krasilnikovia cinnamomea]|uniref:Membrane protease YdiL (CAAX protease family) n=1 Tax=Krasilnikovia cinnamomea TaxID=349313 RepID=A0A4Q7ZTL2_9ACTN|nr:CPBP family intramembrane glutamic endopeptidase [Krasilnikovia cinnamomea]RZU54211.1 membrane protease YdiL (CAAX protease family) [Krasilnikovia cinnamomea]